MVYHSDAVARGANGRAFIIGDLPFGAYQQNPAAGLRSRRRLLATAPHGQAGKAGR